MVHFAKVKIPPQEELFGIDCMPYLCGGLKLIAYRSNFFEQFVFLSDKLFIMPKTYVDKSIYIGKSPSEIFEIISDFHTWEHWSPWLIVEPSAKVNVREDGKYYEWSGDVVGVGNMTVLSENKPLHLHCDLTFLKPWKSTAKINFHLKEEGFGTRVHWQMDGSLPFFMFFLKKMMQAFVGTDFSRGLNMLKDYIEDGKVHSQLEFVGMQEYAGCQYVGIRSECSMEEMAESMRNNFEKLMEYFMAEQQEIMDGNPFSIYHKWNLVKGRVSYTAAVPVKSIPKDVPAGTMQGKVPSTKIHVVRHTGAYIHAGNPWSAQMSMERAKKFKRNKSIHPMEVYLNSPKNTAPKDLITEVWMSVK